MLRLLQREMKWVSFYQQHSRFSSTTSSTGRLEGKIALITGGARGIGKATAQEFVKQGAHVLIADINDKNGPNVASDLGPKAQFIKCDVSIEAQVAEAVDAVIERHGKLDIMYNNAGIIGPYYPPSITDLDLDEFEQVMRVNVRGTVAGVKHAARVMKPVGSGSILCTASICGILGGLGPHPYSISKFAIPGLVKSLASELCKYGIRINCISPSTVATPMVIENFKLIYPNATSEEIKKIIGGLEEFKGTQCEEIDIAKAALYLASDDAKYVTGHNLAVDGGLTCIKSLTLPPRDHFM
ncbi:short-chain dehydrogenase reductase 2a isoform X2 [Spinacia oleracea]|uniref:Short-chain dehydrogenase reductase 2a isoform X2 n=1 Tax=Spinacia oleracea TaxID=3562 RepID=A0ABM3QVE8_SPIOL|nr:short-chain dehydrogenase reductase 2a-like isoform X2 [Spinacia oleracea]